MSKREKLKKIKKLKNKKKMHKDIFYNGKKRLIAIFCGIVAVFIAIELISNVFLNDKIKNHQMTNGTYDFAKFYQDENNFRAYEDAEHISLAGIDVSSHQGEINWRQVKRAGVSFAMIRAGYSTLDNGTIQEDRTFEYNIGEAKKAGIETGAYFFSQAVTVEEAVSEAKWFLDKIKGKITMAVGYDMEEITSDDRISNLTIEERTQIALAFINEVEKAGYKCFVYGNPSWLMTRIDLSKIPSSTPIWLAHYSLDTHFPYNFTMWQYSENGIVDGISVPVDLNVLILKK